MAASRSAPIVTLGLLCGTPMAGDEPQRYNYTPPHPFWYSTAFAGDDRN